MRRPLLRLSFQSIRRASTNTTSSSKLPIVTVQNGTFYRRYPAPSESESKSNPPIFANFTFSLPAHTVKPEHWAIIGLSNAGKTTLLEILRGKHVSLPPNARSFPYLASEQVDDRLRNAHRAIQYVGFDGEQGGIGKSGTRGSYMSARYESRREETDFSVLDYLEGNTDLNPTEEHEGKSVDIQSLEKVIEDLRLRELLSMPISNLSNGQTRRARIARALLGKPLVLLLDEPFMGLDPPTTSSLSRLLHSLAEAASPRLVLALRPQDPLPNWMTHVVKLGPGLKVIYQGERTEVTQPMKTPETTISTENEFLKPVVAGIGLPVKVPSGYPISSSATKQPNDGRNATGLGENIVEMRDVHIKYGEKEVLGDWEVNASEVRDANGLAPQRGLWWNVKRGERWGVFGPNGTGKTTLISLICSDHPLSYSLPIKIFGRGRLPQHGTPGISIFDIQARIGQSSPEVHAFFPRNVSLRRVVENAWADTFLGTPRLTHRNKLAVDACLRWFEAELNPTFEPLASKINGGVSSEMIPIRKTDWADGLRFGEAPFSTQRVALFLRAIVKEPELIVLDEAFSGMDEYVRDKCMLFLSSGETRTFATREGDPEDRRFVIPTWPEAYGQPILKGLREDQTLICVSHIKEEVPSILGKWMCLPEAGNGKPARFGHFRKPLHEDPKQWEEIWAL